MCIIVKEEGMVKSRECFPSQVIGSLMRYSKEFRIIKKRRGGMVNRDLKVAGLKERVRPDLLLSKELVYV